MPSPDLLVKDKGAPSCGQADCLVADPSKGCLEGFTQPESECPHFTWLRNAGTPKVKSLKAPAVTSKKAPSAPTVQLLQGDALLVSETKALTYAYAPRVIAIVGPPKSGKTTLIAGLWAGLALGPVGGYAFAGSDTQPGLERIAFPARTGSGNDRPKTNRTPRSRDVRYLHLAVRDELRQRDTAHLLLSDVPGEFVKDAADSAEGFASLPLLKYADRTLVLIDGEALVDPARRQQAIARTRLFLGNGLDSGAIPAHVRIDVAITKWDLIAASSDTRIAAVVDKMKRALDQSLKSLPTPHKVYKIAARPRSNSELEPRYGLGDLLGEWASFPLRPAQDPYRPTPRGDDRESTRFLWRYPMTPTAS